MYILHTPCNKKGNKGRKGVKTSDFETTSFIEGPYVYHTIYIQKKGILTSFKYLMEIERRNWKNSDDFFTITQ